MVVAVPTNNKLAFSSPALLGWSFVSLASGKDFGSSFPLGRSRVGARDALGSTVRSFMVIVGIGIAKFVHLCLAGSVRVFGVG